MDTPTPRITDASTEALLRLAGMPPGDGFVLSVYLDLTPTEFATAPARKTQITSVLDQAEKVAESLDDTVSHDDRIALRQDIERIRDYLHQDGPPADEARGLAVFCSSRRDLFEILKLPVAPEPRALVADRPHIEPLTERDLGDDWCVLLVSREFTRLLRGSPARLREVERFQDEIPGRSQAGGWKQANFGRAVEKDFEEHMKRTAEAVFGRLQSDPFRYLAVGATEELWPRVQEALHPYLLQRLAGRLDVDVEISSTDDVEKQLWELATEVERKEERALLDRLAEGLGRGERAAAGLEDVRAALAEARVATLLVSKAYENADPLLRLALDQSAAIRTIHHHDDLDPHGGVAALLRF